MRRFPSGSPVQFAPFPSRRQQGLRYGAGIILLATLSACTQLSFLTPKDVLQRTAAAGQSLNSARFTAVGTVQTAGGSTWSFSLTDGILQDRGTKMQYSLHAREEGNASGSVLSLDVVSLSTCNVYFRSQEEQSGSGALWWRATCDGGEEALTAVEDPAFLQLHADAIVVNKDRGIEQLNGRDVFHYDVSMDTGRLIALLQDVPGGRQELADGLSMARENLNGELWVDTETFYIHRLSWGTSPDAGEEDRVPALHFSLHLWDHDAAPSVEVPASAKRYPVPIPSQGYGFLSLFLLLSETGLAS